MCQLRILPERTLPPYSYVPGKFPHPTRDPNGHSYGVEEATVAISDADKWRKCQTYLWGIDLFNNGYYWEAHEAWEAVWHATGRMGPIAEFCKGLIKLAAAGVKAREGRMNGVERHAQRARQLLQSVAAQLGSQQRFMGLPVTPLVRVAEALSNAPDSVVDTSGEPVVVVMPFIMELERK